jgi:hypothetical protein
MIRRYPRFNAVQQHNVAKALACKMSCATQKTYPLALIIY